MKTHILKLALCLALFFISNVVFGQNEHKPRQIEAFKKNEMELQEIVTSFHPNIQKYYNDYKSREFAPKAFSEEHRKYWTTQVHKSLEFLKNNPNEQDAVLKEKIALIISYNAFLNK